MNEAQIKCAENMVCLTDQGVGFQVECVWKSFFAGPWIKEVTGKQFVFFLKKRMESAHERQVATVKRLAEDLERLETQTQNEVGTDGTK